MMASPGAFSDSEHPEQPHRSDTDCLSSWSTETADGSAETELAPELVATRQGAPGTLHDLAVKVDEAGNNRAEQVSASQEPREPPAGKEEISNNLKEAMGGKDIRTVGNVNACAG